MLILLTYRIVCVPSLKTRRFTILDPGSVHSRSESGYLVATIHSNSTLQMIPCRPLNLRGSFLCPCSMDHLSVPHISDEDAKLVPFGYHGTMAHRTEEHNGPQNRRARELTHTMALVTIPSLENIDKKISNMYMLGLPRGKLEGRTWSDKAKRHTTELLMKDITQLTHLLRRAADVYSRLEYA